MNITQDSLDIEEYSLSIGGMFAGRFDKREHAEVVGLLIIELIQACPPEALAHILGERACKLTLAERHEALDRTMISYAIEATGGDVAKAASLLGANRTTVYEKVNRLGLRPEVERLRGENA